VLLESDPVDESLAAEAADIMVSMLEQADAAGELNFVGVADDDLAFDLLDALAVETDPRSQRLVDLMRERGWTGWNRPERLAKPSG
jgi:hypothetical protein